MKKESFTLVEFVITCIIIFTLIGVGSIYFTKTLKGVREITLRNQLADIRLSLKLYQLFHEKYPEDIRTLLTEQVNLMTYSGAVLKKKYVESVRSDKEGFPIDPFGNRFVYRPDIGEVRSGTKEYEKW